MAARVEELSRRLGALVIFRDILQDDAVRALELALRCCVRGESDRAARRIAAFESALFASGDDWSRHLLSVVLASENVCIRNCGFGGLSPVLQTALEGELDFLQVLSRLRLEDLPYAPEFMVGWSASEVDIPAEYRECMDEVGTRGYGMFARHRAFTVENGALVPVRNPDPQTLEQLPGYDRERVKILANTAALVDGRPASNVLLYGDAGTGKSSTVKAVANAYAERGLRLVEVKKSQLFELPGLMDALAGNPLKFIVFIDDLSFTADDDNFAALKAVLEGSVGGRAQNVAVYATSNRRHLVKETLSDRAGDDVHAADTRQELMSLSARFGLIVTFEHPDKERYLHIVSTLAKEYELERDMDTLLERAEGFALRAGGRSARAARQYVELCKAGVL